MTKQLLPAKNVRRLNTRVCGNCKHGLWSDSTLACARPNGPSFDSGDNEHWFYTCDGWSAPDYLATERKIKKQRTLAAKYMQILKANYIDEAALSATVKEGLQAGMTYEYDPHINIYVLRAVSAEA